MKTITRQRLIEAGATCDGLDYFTDLFGEALEIKVEWTEYAQAMVLGDRYSRRYWGWLVHFGFIPAFSMRGWNLSQVNLEGADLSQADLEGANLSGANLCRAKYNDATKWPLGFTLAEIAAQDNAEETG